LLNCLRQLTVMASVTADISIMPSSHFHGLDAGSVTVLIPDYQWDIRSWSVDMTVIFLDVPASTVALLPFSFFRGAIFNMFKNFISSVVDRK